MARSSRVRRAAAVTALATGLALASPLAAPATGADSEGGSGAASCDPFREPVVDTSIPTAQEVLGFPLGDHDVTVRESDRYLRAVSKASPRVVDGVLARSWNGRPLRYAVVGKPKWTKSAALKKIGRDLNALRDADTSERKARRIIKRTPTVLWVAGNVHGGEESGTDASLRVLHELAARSDCAVDKILDRAIVVVLPTQNPDGREADTRRNAYGFDLNRDWFARTQVETDGKIRMLRQLPPQLYIDAHEMGQQGYFFPPNADPVYHDIGETPLNWIYKVYGTAMQKAFQRFGFDYFNGSAYDLFYMGYGDTVPATGFNAAGMTFEKNNQESTQVRVQEQYTAIWATLSAAGRRHSMLKEWRAEHVKAANQGARGKLEPNKLYWEGTAIENQVPDRKVRHYFLKQTPGKAAELRNLVARLQGMDVDVYRLTRSLRVPDFKPYGRAERSAAMPIGTYWIPMAQGQKHWVQAMLNEDTYVPFPYFYDVTAFSGPLLNNLTGGSSGAKLDPKAERAKRVDVDFTGRRLPGAPRVGLWQVSEESSTSIESSGWLRWYFDRKLRLLYNDLEAGDFTAEGLAGLEVLVIPASNETDALDALSAEARTALADWVRAGGRLVTFRNSSTVTQGLGLTTAVSAEPTSDIPGSLLRVEVNQKSPLAKGVGRTAWAMYEYDLLWNTPSGKSVAVRYPTAGDPDWFISGFAQGEEELHGTAAVVDEKYGEGRVVLFGFDPNFRAFTEGTQKLLRNAIYAGDPADPVEVPQGRTAQKQGVDVAGVGDRMVVTVESSAVRKVRALLKEYGAAAQTVSSDGRVSFRVDLGGRSADEHPWARSLADDVASLGDAVVAIRLP